MSPPHRQCSGSRAVWQLCTAAERLPQVSMDGGKQCCLPCRCDAGAAAECSALLAAAGCETLLHTILHAGGVLHDAPLGKQRPELIREVLAPKACGAWNLARSLSLLGIQRCVLFSSIASLTGPAGSANYAGANACLDAQANQLSSAGESYADLCGKLWGWQPLCAPCIVTQIAACCNLLW